MLELEGVMADKVNEALGLEPGKVESTWLF